MKKLKTLLVLGVSACMLASNASTFVNTAYASSASDKDYTIASAYWDSNDIKAIAYWDEAADKTSYKVRLYKGQKALGNWVSASKATYDFTSLIVKNGTGTYRFEVYPTKGNRTSDKVVSDNLSVDSEYMKELKKTAAKITDKNDSENLSSGGPGVAKSTANSTTPSGPGVSGSGQAASSLISNSTFGWNLYNNFWAYKKADTSFAKNEWQLIGEKWYYFGADEFMTTGWLQSGNQWYYLDDTNGDMITGWKQTGGKWYYLNSPNGELLVNTLTPDNYRVDASGAWIP